MRHQIVYQKNYVFQIHCLITKRAQNQEKHAVLLDFRWFFFANAQQAQVLTTMTIEQPCEPTPEVFGLLPPTLLHCLITKMAQNQEKCPFLLVFRYYFLLTLNILKLWQPRQLCHPCELTPGVLGLLPSTLLHCYITKGAQNQEKREFY